MQAMIRRDMLKSYTPMFTPDSILYNETLSDTHTKEGNAIKATITEMTDNEMLPLIKLLHAVYSQQQS